MLDTRLLRYAVAVHRHRSFTKAALDLHIAQPSLSQQIAKLERDLGLLLFQRGSGLVTATREGEQFVTRAAEILRSLDDLEREMVERVQGMGRELVIGATAITGGLVLPGLVATFGQHYPDVQIRLYENTTEALVQMAVDGVTDISLMALPVEHAGLTVQPLFTEPLLLAVPVSAPTWLSSILARHGESDPPTQSDDSLRDDAPPLDLHPHSTGLGPFSEAPFILLKPGFGFRGTVLQLCAEHGFQPNVAYETTSIHTAQAMVANGLGVTIVPEMVAHRYAPAGIRFLTLSSFPTRTVAWVFRKDAYLNKAAQAFLACARLHRNQP